MAAMGNVIVGQSGGPTAVINSSLAGVYQTAKDRGYSKVYGMLYGVQGLLDRRYVDLDLHIRSHLDIELLKRTPSAFLGSCRYKLKDAEADASEYETVFEILKELDISCFIYIGGNDSMDTIKKLADYGEKTGSDIRFVGVPKTIDNDLDVTDHTPGYGSAAKYIGSITKEIIRDGVVYDMKAVTILEIMGRNAGWLTGAAALAGCEDCGGPDMICLPEVPLDMERFIKRVGELHREKKAIIIAVSEGVKLPDGRYLCEMDAFAEPKSADVFGHAMLTGTCRVLGDLVKRELGCKTRAMEFNLLQRCASHIVSRVDITEAFQAGGAAVKAAAEGQTGRMVILRRVSSDPYLCVTDTYDIHKIANVEKTVPLEWIDLENDNVRPEFVNYVKPLIQGELNPMMVEGLPRHLTLAD